MVLTIKACMLCSIVCDQGRLKVTHKSIMKDWEINDSVAMQWTIMPQ